MPKSVEAHQMQSEIKAQDIASAKSTLFSRGRLGIYGDNRYPTIGDLMTSMQRESDANDSSSPNHETAVIEQRRHMANLALSDLMYAVDELRPLDVPLEKIQKIREEVKVLFEESDLYPAISTPEQDAEPQTNVKRGLRGLIRRSKYA